MRVGVFLPPQPGPRPALLWLSGRTCTEQNVITKAGFQRAAAARGLLVLTPDTCPRGPGVADDPILEVGQGASYYIDATQDPWRQHYQMASYIAHELPDWAQAHFPASGVWGIGGHSMGGHGALTLSLREPGRFATVSAMAPVASPTRTPMGRRALSAYLGPDESAWRAWDTTCLLADLAERIPENKRTPWLVEAGADDPLRDHLGPDWLREACETARWPLTLREYPGYDHSYYFVASFIDGHIRWHAEGLGG
jgi:S-formylglutathione hydrolase